MLGGRSREGALVYGHANGKDIDEASAEVGRYIQMGYKAVRVAERRAGSQEALRRLEHEERLRAGRERAAAGDRVVDAASICYTVPQLFEKLRADHGPDIELLHDVHHRLTPIEAARLARDLEPYRLFWLEDCHARRESAVVRADPQALGDAAGRRGGLQLHLGLQASHREAADRLPPHDDRACGRDHACAPHRRLRRAHQVRTGFHGATDLSPVCMGAALHFDTWVPNFGIQEYMHHTHADLGGLPERLRVSRRAPALRRVARPRRHASTRSSRPGIPIRRSSCPSRA